MNVRYGVTIQNNGDEKLLNEVILEFDDCFEQEIQEQTIIKVRPSF